jgi:hypothetical protein
MNKLILILIIGLSGLANAQNADAPAPPPPAGPADAARKACADAMNADPEFARSIVSTVDKRIDQRTIDAHNMAAAQIAENERHVIYAYAAMWILAALFVGFLWYRQQMLKVELATLRRELDAATKEPK